MSHLRTHTVEVGETRRTTWDGRDHLVVPVVMIVEGVLNGELVTAEAMADLPEQWDGRPVVINHPTERGVHVSANSPEQLEQAIGMIFNTHLDGNKLKAEMWVDVEKAPDIVAAFETGHVMEVSTGYFAGTIPEEGAFNGQPYSGVQTGIRPDHLAILPHDIGACSVADGCGAPRVNVRNSERKVPRVSTHKRSPMAGLMTFMRRMFTTNAEDASFNETWSALSNALGMDDWVLDFYDGTVIFERWTGSRYEQFQQAYTIDEATLEVTLEGEPEPVVTRVEYVPTEGEAEADAEVEPVANGVSGKGNGLWSGHPDHPTLAVKAADCGCNGAKTNSGKKVSMKKNRAERLARIKAREATKEDIIDELIETDETEVVEADREALETLPQETLEHLLPEEVLEEVEEEAEAEEEETAPVANLDDYVAGIPDADAREFIMDGITAQRQRRADLIKSLTANKRNEFTRDELAGMRTNQLERLDRMLTPEVSYAGRATPRANSLVEEPLTTMSTHRKEVN